MRLSGKTIAGLALPPGKTDHIEWDDQLPGFGYRMRAGSGGKVLRSWIAQYRRAGGTRRIRLGNAEVLTAERARSAAKEVLAKVALGEDPQADRIDRRGKDQHTLRSVIDEYLAAKESAVRVRTIGELRRYLLGPHFKPLHNMPVDGVTRRDVAARLVAITREHGSTTAARARAALSAFYVWCLGEGLCESNVVIGTNRPAEGKARERTLTDDELAAIWRACRDDDYGRVVRLLVLVGTRRQEVGGLAWSELDLERGTWTIPGERCKNDRQHTLPLVPAALDIVKGVPRVVGRDQLFGERGAQGFTRWSASKRLLDRRCGVRGWRVHDIRRTVATRMADIGVQPHIIEAVLNHRGGHRAGVAGIYNRSPYEREVKAALALWADHVRALVEGGERRVVPIREARTK